MKNTVEEVRTVCNNFYRSIEILRPDNPPKSKQSSTVEDRDNLRSGAKKTVKIRGKKVINK